MINRIATNTTGSYCLSVSQRSHTCHITSSLLQCVLKMSARISNLCDPDPPTLQMDGPTNRQKDGRMDGRHAIAIPHFAL